MNLIHLLKKSLFIVIYVIEFFFGFIIGYLTIALLGMSISIGNYSSSKDVVIYMKSDGIHTDFVFPVKTNYIDWKTIFLIDNTRGKDSTKTHISIGWGDQGFFLNTPEWSDLKFSTAFDAAFYRGKSAIHTNYINVNDFQSDFRELKISKLHYRKLIKHVLNSLKQNNSKKYLCIKDRGYWETDSFYEAK